MFCPKGGTLKYLNSSLTLDISLNFYLPPLVPKKQPKTEKEKPLGDENLQHIYIPVL